MPQCDVILRDIGRLVTLDGEGPALGAAMNSPAEIPGPAAIAVSAGRIVEAGSERDMLTRWTARETRALHGALVTPGLVDCHTHPVFVGTRVDEFEQRAAGASYEQIMAAGGGITSSVRALRQASDERIAAELRRHLDWLRRHGIVALEAKSGYGLSLADELRSLRALHSAQGYGGLTVVPTCLAAHSVPPEFMGRKDDYLDLVRREILPAVARDRLAVAADVFVERGVFGVEDGRCVLETASALGLAAHVHADQLCASGGARLACEFGALSADHLEFADGETIAAMAQAGVTAVLLPVSTLFLGQRASGGERWAPARALIDTGVPVALATDFNPGSSPTANPAFVMSLACLKLGMTPAEALTAFTRNAAHCLRIGADYGSIAPGKRAAFTVWEVSDWREIPYWIGSCVVRKTLIL